jgi:hypothetical protein
MTNQTSAVYDPVIKMTSHVITDNDTVSESVIWNGTLSSLFADWQKHHTDCEEQTGESEAEIRSELQTSGSYQIDSFVGLYFMLHVVQ